VSTTIAPTDIGREVRQSLPRSRHATWTPPTDRPDPVATVMAQDADRLPWLVPLRHERMAASPFAFFRGAAAVMAADLATQPDSGLPVQLCGDAHLSNFGVFASPERRLVFDVNDFDETLPGPFEWDLKRLATSIVLAARERGVGRSGCRDMAAASVEMYRTAMAEAADRGWLAEWYTHLGVDDLLTMADDVGASRKQVKRVKAFARRARSHDQLRAASKLVEGDGDDLRFQHQPPLLVPFRELDEVAEPERRRRALTAAFTSYRASLPDAVGFLLDRYRFVDVALKVVGVGSVGTRCFVVLFAGARPDDLLLLQVKEAGRSVLEDHLPPSRYANPGRRVVEGQQLMQAVSDVFLGWSERIQGRGYYWRQLKDWKGSVDVASLRKDGLRRYGRLCGWTLARAHAVSGDPGAITGYLGRGSKFDAAVATFALRYAKQNEDDHAAFRAAVAVPA
jgi:uncharacterized protein (DUF2252 family)